MVLDKSGSMMDVRSDTIGGVNTFLDKHRAAPGHATLTLVQFSDDYTPFEHMEPIKTTRSLTLANYQPEGWTALHGAVGRAIEQTGRELEALNEKDRPQKVIFVIITDGLENSSGRAACRCRFCRMRRSRRASSRALGLCSTASSGT